MISIADVPDVKYDKKFVLESIVFIQQNTLPDFDKKKQAILDRVKKFKKIDNQKSKDLIKNNFETLAFWSHQDKMIVDLKWRIFFMMKKIALKNIYNYEKLCRNSPIGDKLFDTLEMESECFLIFEKCLYKFVYDGKNDFYFYFNKSLSRNFYKMFTDSLKEIDKMTTIGAISGEQTHDETLERISGIKDSDDDLDFLISSLNLDELCVSILRSKLNGEKMKDFILENPSITPKIYEKSLKEIKAVMSYEFKLPK